MKIKRITVFLLAMLLLLAVLPACAAGKQSQSNTQLTGISISQSEAVIAIGESVSLKTTLTPAKSGVKVSWSSSDENVARVKSGKVTGRAAGTCVITASVKLKSGEELSVSCTVTVYRAVKELRPSQRSLNLEGGESAKLDVTVLPADATCQEIEWSSSDEKVATVSQDGTVTAIRRGKATITARSLQSAGRQITTAVSVTVVQHLIGIELPAELGLSVKETVTLQAKLIPEELSDIGVNWSSSNENVATVSANGVVKGLRSGYATITAKAADGSGLKASCRVRVYYKVTRIEAFETSQYIISEGLSTYLSMAIEPEGATFTPLEWTITDPTVAKIEDGVVTGLTPGHVTITATATDTGRLSVSFDVQVEPAEPVTVTAASAQAVYGNDTDCLFITPVNNCAVRTVEAFDFTVSLMDENGNVTKQFSCAWQAPLDPIGPGKSGSTAHAHWAGLKGITEAASVGITVTKVTFTDRVCQTILPENQKTCTFALK